MAVQRTKAQWAEIIEEYKKSGQTMASWCRENGVNAKTMGNYVNAGKVKRKVRTLYEWGVLFEKQKSSGMSISGWCRENGVKEKAMRTAASKLAKLQESEISEKKATSAEWAGRSDVRKPRTSELLAPASWVAVKIPGATPSIPSTQTSDDEYNLITESVKLPPYPEKGASMRIRLKSLDIEVNNEYPVEKLMILMKGLIALC
jgi:transposase-like protein